MIKILFVCLGNICRSPTAEAVFRSKAKQAGCKVFVDSAGTINWHQGQPPDERSCQTASKFGYEMKNIRSRAIVAADFQKFDFILAMDQQNIVELEETQGQRATRPQLFLDFAPTIAEREVPDPYYGGKDGFTHVLRLIEQASDGLLLQLKQTRSDLFSS